MSGHLEAVRSSLMNQTRVLSFVACFLLAGACTNEIISGDVGNVREYEGPSARAPRLLETGNDAPSGANFNNGLKLAQPRFYEGSSIVPNP
jgi:hypothetical protein